VGLMYGDWLRAQEQASRRVYDDPHREMLRVAGEGAPLASLYEDLAGLYVSAWSLGIPDPLVNPPADGRVFRWHALENMLEDGVTAQDVLNMVWNGTRYADARYPETVVYWASEARPRLYVVVEKATGKIRNVHIYRRLSSVRYHPE